jgi:hypothetical protein
MNWYLDSTATKRPETTVGLTDEVNTFIEHRLILISWCSVFRQQCSSNQKTAVTVTKGDHKSLAILTLPSSY